MKLAYITSSPYSGSTLLSFLLNAHPDIGTISEFDIMDDIKGNPDYLCSCGSKLRECSFFDNLKSDLNNKGMNFLLDDMKLMFSLSENERINRYLTQKLPLINSSFLENVRDSIVMSFPYCKNSFNETYNRNKLFMESVLKLSDSNVFLDANKNPYRLKYLNKKFDSYAIYLYKNGIAGAFSIFKQENRKKTNMPFKAACTRWFLEQLTINRCLQSMESKKIINVAYSDLCSNTETELNKIFDLLDIKRADVSSFSTKEHHIIGNSMRISSIDSIEERLDWKDKLTKDDVSVYMKVLDKYSSQLSSFNEEQVSKLWADASI